MKEQEQSLQKYARGRSGPQERLKKAKQHMEEETRCQNPVCRRPITIIPGHRRRQYCDDACKQAAHRARLEAARLAEEEVARQARIEQERAALLLRWGNMLPETVDLLQSLPSSLVEKVVSAIRAEQEGLRQYQLQEKNELIDSLLDIGEQLGFPTLTNDSFRLEGSVECWLTLCHTASLETLYQARDVAYIRLRAQAARKRLLSLAPQT
jgi:hypothetical protein